MTKIPSFMSVTYFRRIEKEFAQKIILTVIAAKKSEYCGFFNPKMAYSIPHEEKMKIVKCQLNGRIDEYERVALNYARHYAETNGNSDPGKTNELNNFYGKGIAHDIMLLCRRAMAAIMMGNTMDAFLSRLKGHKVPESNLWVELFLAGAHLFFLLPFLSFIKGKRKT